MRSLARVPQRRLLNSSSNGSFTGAVCCWYDVGMNIEAKIDQASTIDFDREQGHPTKEEEFYDRQGVRVSSSSIHGSGLSVGRGVCRKVLRHQTLAELDGDWS